MLKTEAHTAASLQAPVQVPPKSGSVSIPENMAERKKDEAGLLACGTLSVLLIPWGTMDICMDSAFSRLQLRDSS